MADALGTTMYLLAHSRNQAAVPVLISALGSQRLDVRLSAIHGLAVRRNPEGHFELLARLPDFGERDLAVLAESVLRSSHRMQQSLSDALQAEELRHCESACRVILLGRVYQLLPALVEVSEDKRHRHSAQSLATVVQLARLLQEETLARPQDRTCEPGLMRRQVLPALERSVVRFSIHKRLEIIDAFLLLVPPSNETLLQILSDPAHPCHQPVVDSLATSAQVPILDLLTQLAHDTRTPQSALRIVAGRHDRKFLDYLLHGLRSPIPLRVLENFKRLSSVVWLNEERDTLLELDGRAQATAVAIANSGAVDRTSLISLLTFLLKRGQPEGRRASCDALADFHDRHVTQLVVGTLQDPDPRVQAAAVNQLRQRGVPKAMERLIALLDDSAPEVRDAARSSLAEFSFSRYRGSFDSMDQASRQKIGSLVAKVDLSTPQRLGELLGAPSVSTKLRALEMVNAMGAADIVVDHLAQLVTHADPAVRIEVVTTLGNCRQADPLPLLLEAEQDPVLYVREAASRSIDEFANKGDRSIFEKMDLSPLLGLLARTHDLRGFSAGFRSRSVDDNAFEVFLVAGGLVIGCIVLLLVGRYARRFENRKSFDSPPELFRELCRAHGLKWSSRRLLKRLAAEWELPSPALLFVEPERFSTARLPAEWRDDADRLESLRQRLFD